MGKFFSTKTYGTDRGLSCCFRQWRSTHSHCSLYHGYSIGIKLVFECETLDARNWVMDFGGLKEFKKWADYMFDHTMLIAKDDPELENIRKLGKGEGGLGVADLRIVDAVGCERFAEMCFLKMQSLLDESRNDGLLLNPTVKVSSVEVFEHGANSGIYQA